MHRDVATCSSARSSPLPPINQLPTRQKMPPQTTFPSTKAEFVSATPKKRAPLRSGIPVYTATYKRNQHHPLKPLTGRSLSHDGDDVTKRRNSISTSRTKSLPRSRPPHNRSPPKPALTRPKSDGNMRTRLPPISSGRSRL